MTVGKGELVVVLGTRQSGCSTLLRVAAGLERPDTGEVLFDGVPLWPSGRLVGRQISYCHRSFSPIYGEQVIDQVAAPLLAQRVSRREARRAAELALVRTSTHDCAAMHPEELDGAERARVAIARALCARPSILVVDDPSAGVGILHVDGILRMLRSLASDSGVLMSTNDAMCVSGADKALALDDGKLRADAPRRPAEVVPLFPSPDGVGSEASAG
jgi:putative ABC transport system ATP-binding protein